MPSPSEAQSYPPHVEALLRYDGFREKGHNRGWLPDAANKWARNSMGSPYCAAVVGRVLDSVGVESPRIKSGLAANYRTKESIKATDVIAGRAQVQVGDLCGWQKGKTIYGHLGTVIEVIDKSTVKTIDANTECDGRGTIRDGGGVCIKVRTIRPFDYFSIRWFTPVRYPPDTAEIETPIWFPWLLPWVGSTGGPSLQHDQWNVQLLWSV